MILIFVIGGIKVHGPPYTKAEEAEFYSRNANGPVIVAREANAHKGKKSPAPRQPSPAKPRRS
jgi:hypothetical protein